MKLFLSILILIVSLQSRANADDIGDFQIEGMSIGDSLLDYFNEKEINKFNRYDNSNTSWIRDEMFTVRTKQKGPYTEIMLALKKNDKNYIIYGIEGLVKMDGNISECYPKLEKVSKELKYLFPNATIDKTNISHRSDPTGNSKVKSIFFDFTSGDFVSLQCYDWTKKMGYWDNFRVSVITKEYDEWIDSNY